MVVVDEDVTEELKEDGTAQESSVRVTSSKIIQLSPEAQV